MKTFHTLHHRVLATSALLLSCLPGYAQTAPAATGAKNAETEIVTLSPFEVNSTKDVGYQATETLAGTRIRTNLADVGSAIQVITKEFMQDVGATDSGTLLQYTTNAEVAGTRGTYAGLGNSTTLDETSLLRNPSQGSRVRGLNTPDNTRDFFVTDIPWDSYNVDRIDIQRGPNAILFGLGSPAGIVNATLHNAEFHNMGTVEDRVGSYGTVRNSIDVNQELIPGELAIRVDGLWNNQKYEQKQAWQHDKRFSGMIRYDPKLFSDPSFHTSIKAKFENADIKSDLPRIIPPYNNITPWFAADAASPSQRTLDSGMSKFSVLNGYQIGSTGNTFNPWIGGYANQQQPIWFIDGATNDLYRIYGGYVNNGSLNAAGVPQGSAASIVGFRYADAFSDLTSLSTYARNANLPNAQYGQYRDRVLTDPSIFDFYDNLIDGPTKSEFQKWNTFNLDLTQTFWNDRLGVDLSYDRQKFKRGGQQLLPYNPSINIDILQNFQDYVVGPNNTTNTAVANPNYGRPFTPAGPGSGSSYVSDRKYYRASVFGEIRAADWLHNDFLAKLLGKHRFNGVYSDEQYSTENRTWQMYANSLAYASFKTQGAPDGFQNLPPIAVVYLGGSLASASTATGANIPAIGSNVTLQNGNIYQFDSTWRPLPGVVFNAPWNVTGLFANTTPASLQASLGTIPIFNGSPVINPTTGLPYAQLTQVSNPANYVGWSSNFTDNLLRYDNGADLSLLTAAAKSVRVTKSWAGTYQGYLWNDAIVPTLGWRYDEVTSRAVTAQQQGAAARSVLNLSENGPAAAPYPYALPTSAIGLHPNQGYSIFKDHSTSGSLVVHLNKLLGERDFLPINVSLSYDKSSNFQVTDARRDIYGHNIANPTGNTKEYGLLLSTKDGKYSLRVQRYETALAGASTQLSIGDSRSGLIGTIVDSLNWRNIKTYYMSLYTWSSAGQAPAAHFTGVRYMWDPAWVDANGRPVASGALVAGDPRIPSTAVHLETQAEADVHRDAALQAINDFQVWLASKGYFSAWNYGVGPTTQSALQTRGQYEANPTPPDPATVFDYRNNPVLQGFAVTADTKSKGYEYEFIANPTPEWRLAFNASETTAVRSNVGGALLDELVTKMDTLYAGPAGDLTRFNSDWSAGNQLRADWSGWRGQYTLLKLGEGAAAPELRKWRYNAITNYSFHRGMLKGAGVGAGYRWQDKVVIGYPVIPNPTNPTLGSFDLTKPYYGPSEDALDLWVSYERKLTSKIDWRIQLNVYNVGKNNKLIPISVEPDGHTWAAARISPVQEWMVTNDFMF